MLTKINEFTESIVIEDGESYVPKENEFGFVETPYIRLMILASVNSELEDLAYTWRATSVGSTSMTFELKFAKSIQVSLNSPPDRIAIEFHIQEFTDSNGKGIRDNETITKSLPR